MQMLRRSDTRIFSTKDAMRYLLVLANCALVVPVPSAQGQRLAGAQEDEVLEDVQSLGALRQGKGVPLICCVAVAQDGTQSLPGGRCAKEHGSRCTKQTNPKRVFMDERSSSNQKTTKWAGCFPKS